MKIPLILLILTILMVGTAGASTINVTDVDGENNYTTIQYAVNNASSGDTILVYPGTYGENEDDTSFFETGFEVDKKLNITSVGGASVTNITSDFKYVLVINYDDVTINGFNVSGTVGGNTAGIYLHAANHCNLTNNTVSNIMTSAGIYLDNSENNTISNNIAFGNNIGIWLRGSSNNNNLTGNDVSDNPGFGIYLQYSSNENKLIDNTISYNRDNGIYMSGDCDNNTIVGNTIENNGNPYDGTDYYGIHLNDCNNTNLTSNTISDNHRGILLDACINTNLTSNTISDNDEYGIWATNIGNTNLISNNTIAGNGYSGVYLQDCYYLSLAGNTISGNGEDSGNGYGIDLEDSNYNQIFNNYLNNSENVDIDYPYLNDFDNEWNTTKTTGPNIIGGPYIGGNFWATPDGTGFSQLNTDSDGDGFCDSTKTINTNNNDSLPLVMPPPLNFTESPAVFFINNDGNNRSVNTNFTFAYSGKNISLWTKLDNESDASVVADFSEINESFDDIPFEYQGDGVFVLLNHSIPDADAGVYNIFITATKGIMTNNTVCPVMLNFNPQSSIDVLNSNTTDWTTIEDPTNVSNLTFGASDSNGNVLGSLEFTETVNLCDIEFAQRLQQFGEYINFTTAQTSLDSANLSRLNNSTSLTMYGLGSFDNQPGILLDGQPILEAGNTSSDSVSGLEWDAENGTLTFSVNHWSTYIADGEVPEVTAISPKEKSVKVGDTLELNVSVKDASGISSVVVNVSSINDTVDEAVLTNVSGYWVNNSIMVDTDAEDTYYLNINATDVLGNYNNTVNLSVIMDDTVKADDDEESSSGGRSSVGPSMPPEDVEGTDSGIKRVLAGSNVKYDFSDGEGPVLGISFDAKDDKGTVVAKVQVLKDKLDDVDDPTGNPYKVMSITVGSEGTISDENADNILIEFKVSKEWIEENNIDPSTIRMTRFHDGEWQDLPSDSVGEDDEYFYFNAETPGFSIFSIVGDKVKEEAVEEEPATEQQPPAEEVEEPASETEDESAQTPGFTAMFAVALIAGAALIMRRD
ncbi:NosD domain-containing protein [Methanohalophilus profundi]|uniref:NosD domain-containing protein n=1 Tax=Methanohalophilus profundi TaxID=2138083 RepID=UPI00101C89EF|nr:NosD domain-containing protein [Methanohalophilus profundi]